MIKIEEKTQVIKKIGDYLVDIFHYFALFSIGATIVWSAVQEYLDMMRIGHARLMIFYCCSFTLSWARWSVSTLKRPIYRCSI